MSRARWIRRDKAGSALGACIQLPICNLEQWSGFNVLVSMRCQPNTGPVHSHEVF